MKTLQAGTRIRLKKGGAVWTLTGTRWRDQSDGRRWVYEADLDGKYPNAFRRTEFDLVPIYTVPDIDHTSTVERYPFELPDYAAVQTYSRHGASVTYGTATVIGSPLMGAVDVWRSPRQPGVLKVQHAAHRNAQHGPSRFTTWDVPDNGAHVTHAAHDIMQQLVDRQVS